MKQATPRLTALDTNVLARYYVQADQTDAGTVAQCEQARVLLESGKPLFVATTVALELEWVLRGFYKLKPKTVAAVFTHLLALPHLQVVRGFDFADALHHASSRHCDVFTTFDVQGFAKRAAAQGWAPKVQAP